MDVDKKPSISAVIGDILITVGMLLLLFAFYEAFWTNVESNQLQAQANEELEEEWRNPREAGLPELGDAFARIYVPAFGTDWNFAILEGATDEVLTVGPARYSETQMPGEIGNFALAGHRVGKGEPFNDLGQLDACDAVVVETATEWITYRVLPMGAGERDVEAAGCFNDQQVAEISSGQYAGVLGRHITLPGDVGVLAPVPGEAGATASEGLITMTTCHPQFSAAERMIIHAMMVNTEPKADGFVPDVMEER